MNLAARARAIRDREAAVPLRLDPNEPGPVYNIAAVDDARSLARHAERLHRQADAVAVPFEIVVGRDKIARRVYDQDSPEAKRAEALRRQACDFEAQADALVPMEHRG